MTDLHFHSTASDGTSTPAEVAREALEAGLTAAALSDHDTADGVPAFLAEAGRIGLRALSALEYNVSYTGEMHVLAYGFDPGYQPLLDTLEDMANQRRDRSRRMVEKLNGAGYPVSLERVLEIAGEGVVGRPHIAAALAELGYAKDAEEGYVNYLEPGKAGFVPRMKIDSHKAIALAKEAGGICVLAHPIQAAYPDYEELLDRLTEEGLEGIEVYYPSHTDEVVEYFYQMAQRRHLLMTQGSDYHGKMRKKTRLGSETRGEGYIRESVEELFRRARPNGKVNG